MMGYFWNNGSPRDEYGNPVATLPDGRTDYSKYSPGCAVIEHLIKEGRLVDAKDWIKTQTEKTSRYNR